MTATHIIPTQDSPVGTCLQDYVDTTYANIVDTFGPPNAPGDGHKVDAEWTLMTPAGIATIYNYKSGHNYLGAAGTPVEQITTWHIGGADYAVVRLIRQALGA